MFSFFYFNSWKITFQCCVGFCHTTTRVSHGLTHTHTHIYIYIPYLLSLPVFSLSHPSGSSLSARLAGLPVLYNNFPLTNYFTHDSIFMSMLLSQSGPPHLPHCVHKSVFFLSFFFYKSVFYSVHQYHFSRFHMHVLMYDTCFSDFTSPCITGFRFTHLTTTDSDSFLFMAERL